MSLKIRSLTKFFGEKCVLDNFSYDFSDKGLYIITGESGIGKTTLLRIIAGLDHDFDGEIIGCQNVSFAFQEYRLFQNLNAVENVVLAISNGKDEAVYDKAIKMIRRLGIEDSDRLKSIDELSGGMKQRISLARAFLFNASILLLDEPTKELDKANAAVVREIICEQAKERLVIMVSHSSEDIDNLTATEIKLYCPKK